MRVNLFDTALNMGLAHLKDVLMKRLKRAVGLTLATKYATNIVDLCYEMRNEELIPHTLLKNGKRSATFFLASRSKSPSNGWAPHSKDTPRSLPKSNDCNRCASNPPQVQDEQNGAITCLTMMSLNSNRKSSVSETVPAVRHVYSMCV